MGDKMVTGETKKESPRLVYLEDKLPPAYHPKGIYVRMCRRLLRADSRIARLITGRQDRGAFDHIEVLYHGEHSNEGIFGGKLDKIFMESKGGRSIRTRTEKAGELNYKYAREIARNNGGEVNILSLGSGSAREIIVPLKRLKDEGIDAHATCVDLDAKAIEFSSKLAEEAGVRERITYKQHNILDVVQFPDEPENPKKFNLVSIVGMCEYLELKDNVIWFGRHVKERIARGGYIIASNMKKHERIIEWAMDVTGWKLVYKEPEEFSNVVRESGFNIKEECYEPDTELHRFVVGQNPA